MYKIMKKILLCLILVLIFYFNLRNVSINTKSNSVIEKVYCNATLEQDFSDNEILIVLNKETSRQLDLNMAFESIDYDELEDLTSSYDTVDEMNDNFRRIYKMTIKDSNKQKILNVIKELEDIDYVYAAEPNYFDKVLSVPNDYSSTSQYAVNMMDLDKAWNFTTGCSEITVGIIDTGVDGDHADLQDNINVELSRSFSADFTDPLDDLVGHGTHVAGIIGAVGNNGIGLTGVN